MENRREKDLRNLHESRGLIEVYPSVVKCALITAGSTLMTGLGILLIAHAGGALMLVAGIGGALFLPGIAFGLWYAALRYLRKPLLRIDEDRIEHTSLMKNRYETVLFDEVELFWTLTVSDVEMIRFTDSAGRDRAIAVISSVVDNVGGICALLNERLVAYRERSL